MTVARQSDYITTARNLTRQLWEAVNALEGMQAEWSALDYGTTLEAGTGANEGIAAADVGSVVFATTDAIRSLLNTGHATNLAKLL